MAVVYDSAASTSPFVERALYKWGELDLIVEGTLRLCGSSSSFLAGSQTLKSQC